MRVLPALVVMACLACTGAYAKQSDSTQPVEIRAHSSMTSQDKEITTLTGDVRIDQGTMHLDGDKAVGNFDQNNQLEHARLTGNPAHMRQQMDDGSLVHGQADTIDYTVSANTVVLTGNAVVVHEGQGETHAAKITYNTDTGQMTANGGTGGEVHMILQPKAKAAPASKPPSAVKPAAASTAGAAKPSTPAPAASTVTPPASGTSAGAH